MNKRQKIATQCSGEILKRLMEETGMTKEALARKLNRSPEWVAGVMSGKKRIEFVDFMDLVTAMGLEPSVAIRQLTAILDTFDFRHSHKGANL